MLKTILSVSGKSGLYKLISSAKNMIIVESLIDKKRVPVFAKDKVVSLGDIAMYTDEGEEPLKNVLSSIKNKENGGKVTLASSAKSEELYAYFGEVLPTFDRERVYPTDIKKLISWYNLLVETGIDFEQEESAPTAENPSAEAVAPAELTEAKPKVKTPKAKTAAPKASSDAKVSQRATRKKV